MKAGTHCPGDGAAVNSGPDTNGDGILQDSEVTKTEYVCDRVILGNVTVYSQLELLALADVVAITGDLDISHTDNVVNVDLPALKHVGGDLNLDYLRELRNVSLPALERVGGSIKFSSLPKVDRLDLRALRNIGMGLRVAENPELVAMDFTSLQYLNGSMWVLKNPKLTELGLSSLRWADELILWNVATKRLELPQLYDVRALSIADGTSTELHLPALAYVRATIVIAGMKQLQRLELPVLNRVVEKFIVRDTQVLTSFSLPNLQELPGEFDLWSNAGLTTFDVPKLQSIGGWLYISDNDALTTLSGLKNVTSVGGMLMLYGNARLTTPEGLAALRSVGSYIQVERSGFTDFHLPSLNRAWILIIGRLGGENQQLKSIRLPGLEVARSLTLVGNPELDTLDLPAARFITDSLFISFTPKLASCRVEALLGSLLAPPPKVELHDLDTRPICQ
ncbi:DUF7151 family protein [Archangium lansingense]|uniref:DUF7151 family protein n=1 Tax=Archangium lansingense TaxID=2995310 RepID=UPI003B766AC4